MIVQSPANARQSAALTAERRGGEGAAAERETMEGKTSVVTVILTHSLQVTAGPMDGGQVARTNPPKFVSQRPACAALGDRNLGAV